MNISLPMIFSMATLVGSILIGGSNFGDLRTQSRINTENININRERIINLDLRLRSELLKSFENIATMRSDIRWIKESMDDIDRDIDKNKNKKRSDREQDSP